MRVASTAFSLVFHAAAIIAAVWATAQGRPAPPKRSIVFTWPSAPSAPRGPTTSATTEPGLPPGPILEGDVAVPVPLPRIGVPGTGDTLRGRVLAVVSPSGNSGDLVDAWLADDAPVVLAGLIPTYPELLRQAGIQGRVVLEAIVDTTGHVEGGSIVVVSTAHPGLVAAARQALLGALFRPGRTRGQAVRVRVRIPIDFRIQGARFPA